MTIFDFFILCLPQTILILWAAIYNITQSTSSKNKYRGFKIDE